MGVRQKIKQFTLSFGCVAALCVFTGCSSNGVNSLSPFSDSSSSELGQRNNKAILGQSAAGGVSPARQALEVLGSRQRAQAPQPYYPVLRPAEVRKMWVPDHLNRVGDLVPAHYYYLKVKDDEWAVKDAFEIEGQLNRSTGSSSGVPFRYAK